MKTSPQPTVFASGLFSLFIIGYILLNDYFMQLITFWDMMIVFIFTSIFYTSFWVKLSSVWFPFQEKKGVTCSCPDCSNEITKEKDQAIDLFQQSFFASSTVFEAYCLSCKKKLVPRFFLMYIFIGWTAIFAALYRFIFELSLTSFQEQDTQIAAVFIGVSIFWSIVLWSQGFPKIKSQRNTGN